MHFTRHLKAFTAAILTAAMVLQPAAGITTSAASSKTYYYTGSSAAKKTLYKGSSYKVYYDGKQISSSTNYGVYINGNFMIPYKACLVNAGPKMKSSFSSKTKKLTLNYNGTTVSMKLGQKYMLVNNKKVKLRTAATYFNVRGTKRVVVPALALSNVLGLSYSSSKSARKLLLGSATTTTNNSAPAASQTSAETASGSIQASSFANMTTSQFIATLGPIAQQNYKSTGIKASVTLAQAIIESGWGKSYLAKNANNIFGMKKSLSGNTWAGSVWDGSAITISTTEEYNGKKVTIKAQFRKYSSVNASVADHSAYLANAMNGSSKRYVGITDPNKTYTQQLQILQKGGYCTWSSYVSELTGIIKKYNLTKYDVR